MADATPFVTLPVDAEPGVAPATPAAMDIGGRRFAWGVRTYVMGIVNVTPDSFSGDGLLADRPTRAADVQAAGDPASVALELGRRMAAEGADLLDVGGESTRPGHAPVTPREESRRVVPAVGAIYAALPDLPISVDTRKVAVAAAALDAGAALVNDVAAVTDASDGLFRLVAERGVPLVLMHDRAEARYRNVVAEVIADIERAIERAVGAGVAWERLIVDPGMGFGKTAEHNLALLHGLAALRILGRPVLLGLSRKSTIGRVLDLPPRERLEGTLAATALGIAAGVDIVRVHDVEANRRAARMSDAIIRRRRGDEEEGTPR